MSEKTKFLAETLKRAAELIGNAETVDAFYHDSAKASEADPDDIQRGLAIVAAREAIVTLSTWAADAYPMLSFNFRDGTVVFETLGDFHETSRKLGYEGAVFTKLEDFRDALENDSDFIEAYYHNAPKFKDTPPLEALLEQFEARVKTWRERWHRSEEV